MIVYAFSASLTSLLSGSVDINFYLTQPPLFAIWGWILKILRGQKYICLVMDIYPDVAVQDGLLRDGSLLLRLLSNLNLLVWRNADAVIVIGRCMQMRLLQKGVPAEKIHLITNWANEKVIFPVPNEKNRLKSEYGLQGAFIVLYSGNMGVSHEFRALLNAAENLLPYKTIRFVFIGDGRRRVELEKQVESRRLENIVFLPFQPLERLSESLSLGDIHLVTLRDGFEGLIVPSKAYGALVTGRPIIYIGDSEGEIARMVTEEKIGTVVSNNDEIALTKAILSYFHNEMVLKEHGLRALQLSQNRYSRKNSIYAYLDLIMGIQNDSE